MSSLEIHLFATGIPVSYRHPPPCARRGTDVLKALALGADAVLLGRPVLWGLAVGGEEGVLRVLELLRAEVELAMALAGRSSLGQIDSSLLVHPSMDSSRHQSRL